MREEYAYLASVESRITAHPGPKMEARKYQLLSLRMKVAQLRAMEDELVAFLASESALPLERFEQL